MDLMTSNDEPVETNPTEKLNGKDETTQGNDEGALLPESDMMTNHFNDDDDNNNNNHDDSFRDFATAATTASDTVDEEDEIDDNETEVKTDRDNIAAKGDDHQKVGGFSMPVHESDETPYSDADSADSKQESADDTGYVTAIETPTNMDDEEDGNEETAARPEEMLVVQQETNQPAIDNDFGKPSAAAAVESSTSREEQSSLSGGIQSTENNPVVPGQETAPAERFAMDAVLPDDIPGGETQGAPTTTSNTARADIKVDDDDDDDGGGDEFGAFAESTEDVVDRPDQIPQVDDDDVPSNLTPAATVSENDGMAIKGSKVHEDADDEFGDFGGLGTFNQADTANMKKGGVAVESEQATTSEAIPTDKGGEGDDGLGDLGPFTQVDSTMDDAVNVALTTDADRQEVQPHKETTDDDDFGDFGSFEQPAQTTTQAPQAVAQEEAALQPDDGDDDDFDDFGEFADFATAQGHPEEGDEHSAHNDLEMANRSVPETSVDSERPASIQTTPSEVVAQVVQKAESIFGDVFGHVVDESAVIDVDSSTRTILSVHTILSSLDMSVEDRGPSDWCTNELSSVLRGESHLGKAGPVAVVNQNSMYPYAHFAVPIGGLPLFEHVPNKRTVQQRCDSSPQRTQFAPLVSGAAAAAAQVVESMSPDSAASPSPVEAATQAATVVNVPPLKSDTHPNGAADTSDEHDFSNFMNSATNGKKDRVAGFLQQIPDLSFMLKPTLSLPKKS